MKIFIDSNGWHHIKNIKSCLLDKFYIHNVNLIIRKVYFYKLVNVNEKGLQIIYRCPKKYLFSNHNTKVNNYEIVAFRKVYFNEN